MGEVIVHSPLQWRLECRPTVQQKGQQTKRHLLYLTIFFVRFFLHVKVPLDTFQHVFCVFRPNQENVKNPRHKEWLGGGG